MTNLKTIEKNNLEMRARFIIDKFIVNICFSFLLMREIIKSSKFNKVSGGIKILKCS